MSVPPPVVKRQPPSATTPGPPPGPGGRRLLAQERARARPGREGGRALGSSLRRTGSRSGLGGSTSTGSDRHNEVFQGELRAPWRKSHGKFLADSGHPRRPAERADLDRPRPRSRRRLRSPVRPADRPPGARGEGLLRDRPALDAGRGDAGPQARGDHPLRRPVVGLRAGRAGRRRRACSRPASRSSACATASRRWPRCSAARWPAPASPSSAVRRSASPARARCSPTSRPSTGSGCPTATRSQQAPDGLRRARLDDGDPGGRLRGHRAAPGRRAVAPRGAAHRARPAGARALPARHRRLPADLDDGQHRRGADRADPRADRRLRPRDLRACRAASTPRSPRPSYNVRSGTG